MEKFDFLPHCTACQTWCCKGENPYATKKELAVLGLDRIGTNPNGTCELLQDGKCSRYEERPFECRVFPFDILELDGKLTWVLWNACGLSKVFDGRKKVDEVEKELFAQFSFGYILGYVEFHKKNQPQKYSSSSYQVLRPIKRIQFIG